MSNGSSSDAASSSRLRKGRFATACLIAHEESAAGTWVMSRRLLKEPIRITAGIGGLVPARTPTKGHATLLSVASFLPGKARRTLADDPAVTIRLQRRQSDLTAHIRRRRKEGLLAHQWAVHHGRRHRGWPGLPARFGVGRGALDHRGRGDGILRRNGRDGTPAAGASKGRNAMRRFVVLIGAFLLIAAFASDIRAGHSDRLATGDRPTYV